jgi:hypothetical protein
VAARKVITKFRLETPFGHVTSAVIVGITNMHITNIGVPPSLGQTSPPRSRYVDPGAMPGQAMLLEDRADAAKVGGQRIR